MKQLLALALFSYSVCAFAQTDLDENQVLASNGDESATASPVTTAQSEESYPHSISAKVLFVDYGVMDDQGSSVTNGIEAAYLRKFTDLMTVALPAKVGLLNEPENPQSKRPFVGADLTLQIGKSFFNERIHPYAMVGGGFVVEAGNGMNVQAPLGAGVRIRLSEAASLVGQYEWRKSFAENRDNSQVGIGIHFNLGKGKFNPKFWDTDGDGVMDDVDECIEVYGSRFMKGCPDSDGDGISDAGDPCPNHYGTKKQGGCPDADEDGIADPFDECPEVAGIEAQKGCPLPDMDSDGFGDDVDECPKLPGSLNGCPDADADGITDDKDTCPKQAGPKSTGGCPDRDNDGVADINDNCPLMPGDLNGCPDRDNDGVDDASDRCPNIAGEFDGCPEIMRSQRDLFEYAVRAIGFDQGSTNLSTYAFENLNGIADILEAFPDYTVIITGHADFGEPVADRTAFSKQRAAACATYLISRGVEESRIQIEGVGAGRPIKRIGSDEERAVNRRVEFDLSTAEE